MNGTTTEVPEAAAQAAPATETTPKKAKSRATKPRVAPVKAKATKKTTPAKKAPKTAPKAAPKAKAARPAKAAKENGPRQGSKTEKILTLLKRADGVTLKELMKATAWQAHSVRGFLSAAVGKKMGLTVVSAKDKGGERTYSVKA